jgi:hypothetical protein
MAKPAAKAAKPAAKSTPNVDIANINRTSDVQQADYINTLLVHSPEALEDIVDPATVKAVQAAIKEAGDKFTSSTATAIQKTIDTKVAAAVKALTNDAKLTGYAGRVFDAETFAKKVQPKVGRVRLSPEEKASRVVEDATPEQLEALAALLKAKGISVPE